jgi:cytochrome c oxidase assembly protein subunit 15
MDAADLVNLSPIARLMLMGVVVAVGPLAWVWLRNRRADTAVRLRALTALTLFLTFDLVLFGAFTRLTDSGLGCPDWPGCYGSASPLGAQGAIAAAQQAMPTGPVTHGKAWVEMIHRYLATGVGVLILTLTAASWLSRASSARATAVPSPWWPTLTLVWVCVQGAFGALTVTMKLFPAIVTLHLIGGVVLLALLAVQLAKYPSWPSAPSDPSPDLAPRQRAFLAFAAVLVMVQVTLGGWVSTNYAVLACTDFPTCQGRWWPNMDFRQGFEIWRELGHTGDGALIGFAALTAVHVTHRAFAVLVLGVLALLAWQLHRLPGWREVSRSIAALAAWQLCTGLSNIVLGWPLLAAVAHTGGAAALVTVLVWSLARSRGQPLAARAGVSNVLKPVA